MTRKLVKDLMTNRLKHTGTNNITITLITKQMFRGNERYRVKYPK